MRRLLLLLSIFSVSLVATPSQAQTVAPCTMRNLEVTLQIAGSPDHDYILAANFRNISGRACSLNRAADEPSFYFATAPPEALFTRCLKLNEGSIYECAPSRESVAGPGVTLDPGGVGHQSYSWKATPAVSGGPCVKSHWMENTVNQDSAHLQLLSEALLKPICSPVYASAYQSGEYPSDDDARNHELAAFPLVHFMADKDRYYLRERVPFSIVIDDPGGLLPLDEHSCPTLLTRLRNPSGRTRFEEVWRKTCKLEGTGGPTGGVRSRVESALEATQLAVGDNEVDVSAVAELRGRQVLVSAGGHHWTVADPATIPRKWGPQVKGVAVALTLDRDAYELGHDIPLHVAMANFAAEVPIVDFTPIWDPPVVEVELRDSCGVRIEPRGGAMWLGHGLCGQYLRGQIVPNELSLRDMGLLPSVPGAYTVVAIWKPSSGKDCGLTFHPTYVTVESAPATFHIVDTNHPEAIRTEKCAQTPAGDPK